MNRLLGQLESGETVDIVEVRDWLRPPLEPPLGYALADGEPLIAHTDDTDGTLFVTAYTGRLLHC